MDFVSQLPELQKAANYRWLRKTLRAGGFGSIVFGMVALLFGLPGAGADPISSILAVIGTLLFLEGFLAVIYPTPKGVIFDGSMLMLVGIWNIVASLAKTGPGMMRGFVILGALQVMWGIKRFSRYRLLSDLEMSRPSKQILKWMDNLAILIYSAKPFEFGDVIAMQTEDSAKMIWKALITGDTAVFIEGFGDRMLFAAKNRINISRLDTSTSTELPRVAVSVEGVSFTAVTPIQHLDRFDIWQRGLNEGDWAGFSGMKLAESVDWEAVR